MAVGLDIQVHIESIPCKTCKCLKIISCISSLIEFGPTGQFKFHVLLAANFAVASFCKNSLLRLKTFETPSDFCHLAIP